MNLFPDKVFESSSNGNGNLLTYEYSLEAHNNWSILSFFIILGIVCLIAPLVPVVLFILYLWDSESRPYKVNILGVLVALYLLIDHHNHWIVSIVMGIAGSETTMQSVAYFNGGMLITHLVFLIYGGEIYDRIKADEAKSAILILYFIVITAVSYPVGSMFVKMFTPPVQEQIHWPNK